jgi:hypothetical protein
MMLLRTILFSVSLTLLSFSANSSLLYDYSPVSEKTSFEVKKETVREKIIIDINNNEDWEYMIFTEDGCCVRMGILEKGKNKISLKDMCKGEYFVYLSNGEERYMEKVKQ